VIGQQDKVGIQGLDMLLLGYFSSQQVEVVRGVTQFGL